MKYTYQEGVKRPRSRWWVVTPIFAAVCSAYCLAVVFGPTLLYVLDPADRTAKTLVSSRPIEGETKVYIPKLNVMIPVVPVTATEDEALEQGAVQRSTSSGDPKSGGNYVLVAHRLDVGFTPQETYAKSPLYHIGKVAAGDDVYVDYEGVRYAYKVKNREVVGSVSTDAEKRTETKRLTLYTHEAGLLSRTYEVVVAEQVGTVTWGSDGKPRLKSL